MISRSSLENRTGAVRLGRVVAADIEGSREDWRHCTADLSSRPSRRAGHAEAGWEVRSTDVGATFTMEYLVSRASGVGWGHSYVNETGWRLDAAGIQDLE